MARQVQYRPAGPLVEICLGWELILTLSAVTADAAPQLISSAAE